jgi:hypothetical protein
MKAEAATTNGDAVAFLHGGGAIGERLHTVDWTASPLGPPADWPQSLKTAVRIMLACPAPMQVWWGDQLAVLSNHAALTALGDSHTLTQGLPAA